MAFGTFDYFHAGHEHYLREAKKLGDELIVIIARDKTVRQIKGEAPQFSERQRMKRVKQAQIADKVVLGYHGDKYKVLKKYRPTIIALGYDQYAFTQQLKRIIISNRLSTSIKRLDAHQPNVYKSSLLKQCPQN